MADIPYECRCDGPSACDDIYKPDLDLCDDFGADLDTAEIMQYN